MDFKNKNVMWKIAILKTLSTMTIDGVTYPPLANGLFVDHNGTAFTRDSENSRKFNQLDSKRSIIADTPKKITNSFLYGMIDGVAFTDYDLCQKYKESNSSFKFYEL